MTTDHKCQAFNGHSGQDPDFPMTYQRDPWCWAPELGFHRRSAPMVRLHPRAKTAGSRAVGKDFLHPWQAVRLGLQLGTSNGSFVRDTLPEYVERLTEAAQGKGWDTYPDAAEAHARLGADMLHMVRTEAADSLQKDPRAAREWIAGALRPFLGSPALGPWGERLGRLLDDDMPEDEMRGYGPQEEQAYRSRAMWAGHDPEAWLTYCAAEAVRIIGLQDPLGAVRPVCRLYVITGPTPPDVVQWWRHVLGDAVRIAGTHG